MNVVITGSNGMLGSSLCAFYNNDHHVYAFHRNKHCLTDCSDEYRLDLLDNARLTELIHIIQPDVLIHCAGLTSIDKCETNLEDAYSSNVIASENLARACSNTTKFVFISTDQVYGNSEDHSELNNLLKPINYYGFTKLTAEQRIKQYRPDCMIIRTNIFGWNRNKQKTSSAEWIYNSLENRQDISLFDDYIFSPIYTTFLAEVIIQLIRIEFSGTINIGSPVPCSKYAFGGTMARLGGFEFSFVKKISILDSVLLGERSMNVSLATCKAQDLGLKLPDFTTSLSQFLGDK